MEDTENILASAFLSQFKLSWLKDSKQMDAVKEKMARIVYEKMLHKEQATTVKRKNKVTSLLDSTTNSVPKKIKKISW